MNASNINKSNTKTKGNKGVHDRAGEDEFMAAAIGDAEWLKQSVKPGRPANFDKNGLAALHLSALHGRLDCVKHLVEKCRHDVNLKSSTGWTPLHLAISNQTGRRSFSVLQYLLSKGADFSATNDDGITALHQAASEGHLQCLKALIEQGAKIYVKDCRGHTPLDLAKLWGHRQCARILATEQWFQEKDEIAKELGKLKKTTMIEELNNLSALEDQRAGKQFYGAGAYADWLSTKGLQVDDTGVKVKSGRKKSADKPQMQSKQSTQVSGLYKPNSIADARILGSRTHVSPQHTTLSTPKRERTMDSLPISLEYYTIYEKPEVAPTTNKNVMSAERRKTILSRTHYVKEDWNFSPQCKLLGHYQKDLQDCYPRNPVTKLPLKDAAPKYLATHKNVPISAFSKPDAYKTERRVIFQPETILDAQTKVKYSEEQVLNKPQVFMHLTNDLGSQMFHRGLYIDPFKDDRTSSKSSISSPSIHLTKAATPQPSQTVMAVTNAQMSTPFYPTVGGILPQ